MVKKRGNGAFPFIATLLFMIAMAVMLNKPSNLTEMKMSEAIDLFKQNKVEEFELNLGNGNLKIDLKGEEEDIVYSVPSVNYFVEKIDLNTGSKLKAFDVIYSKANGKKMEQALEECSEGRVKELLW